jgi:peroxiredoxin
MKNLIILSFLFTSLLASAQGYKIGDTVKDFKLNNVDGRDVSLADYGDTAQGYVIVFTCNHCPFAKMYEQRFIDFHNKYADRGWPIIAINPNNPETVPDDSPEAMAAIAQEKNYPFVYLFDAGQQVYPQFGATKTPHIFLLDKDMKVRYIGAFDNNAESADAATKHYLKDAIEAIEAGKDPEPATTRAVGCTIKL